ncbi:MAG: biotin--[acetyl-CoA-carboxylase] ligase [Calditrichaeota bacterium]|nr:MAG: biotin--[acetyl-CoA-carboxylase] ligase [Calditrichota bacterium]
MLFFTDCKSFTEHLFNIHPPWQNYSGMPQDPVLKKLIPEFFRSGNLFTTANKSGSLWRYVIIADDAQNSQFSTLIEFVKNEADLPGGILCLARTGKNFTGFRNRNWISLPGNLHLSAYLKPDQVVENFHTGFTILSALSVIQTLDKIPGLQNKASIKWINDILINNCKISGVLTHTRAVETKITDLFLGIGINIESTPQLDEALFTKKATSIKEHIAKPTSESLPSILDNLLQNLAINYKLLLNGQYRTILDLYRKRSMIIGKNIEVYSDPQQGEPVKINSGKVTSIGDNLELFLEHQKEPIIRGRITWQEPG